MTKVFLFPGTKSTAAALNALKQVQQDHPFELVVPALKVANTPPPEPPQAA
ncbi:hypothetical protein [Pseudoalteromonas sp. T1lg22]|uniref:hypothetical protein n=1 Tax=Pseudoalteromonas sp. T1lg22 TaxID=2077096 RepID=UPI00131A29F0|nr:hypothetical protein [Pseudoalteromonas sp. T1lg22]